MHAIRATFILLSSNSPGSLWNGIDLIKASVYSITLLLRTWVRLPKEIKLCLAKLVRVRVTVLLRPHVRRLSRGLRVEQHVAPNSCLRTSKSIFRREARNYDFA
jgi:hypothetical protein